MARLKLIDKSGENIPNGNLKSRKNARGGTRLELEFVWG